MIRTRITQFYGSRRLLSSTIFASVNKQPTPAAAVADEIVIPVPKRIHRPNETARDKIARLQYQSRKRGILECDLILSTFAHTKLPALNTEELTMYDSLLDEQDWDLYYWMTGDPEHPVPEHVDDNKVFKMLQQHVASQRFKKDGASGSGMFRMPDLDDKK